VALLPGMWQNLQVIWTHPRRCNGGVWWVTFISG
jgi:hypothetical protein